MVIGTNERNPKKWCSESCRNRAARASGKKTSPAHYRRCAVYVKECEFCGIRYVARVPRSKNCGRELCQKIAARKRSLEYQRRFKLEHGVFRSKRNRSKR